MDRLALVVIAAVDTDSTAYGVGQIFGTVFFVAVVGLVAVSIFKRRVPLRPKAVLLTIGGIFLALTIVGELLLAAGLTK